MMLVSCNIEQRPSALKNDFLQVESFTLVLMVVAARFSAMVMLISLGAEIVICFILLVTATLVPIGEI